MNRLPLRTLLSFALFAVLLLAAAGSASAADGAAPQCTGDFAALRLEIEGRQTRLRTACAPVVDMMESLMLAKQRYARRLVDATGFRRGRVTRIFEDDLLPLRDMIEAHQAIGTEAAAAGVLLSPEIAKLVADFRAGTADAPAMFGIPTAAMSVKPAEIATMQPLKNRHDANYLKMEEFARGFSDRAGRLVTRANAELAERRAEVTDLARVHQDLQAQFRRMFDSREFEHCLGTPAPERDGAVSAISFDTDGAPVRADGFGGVGGQAPGTLFADLPGVQPEVTSVRDAMRALADLPDPVPGLKLPAELAFKRDGVRIFKDFAEAKLLQDEANRRLARIQLLDSTVGNFLRTPGYLVNLGKTLVSGAADAVYRPFVENFSDESQNIAQAAFGTLGQIGFEALEGVVRSASNLIGDGLDMLSPGGQLIKRETAEADRSAQEQNAFNAAATAGSAYLAEIDAALASMSDPILLKALTEELEVDPNALEGVDLGAVVAKVEEREALFQNAIQEARDRAEAARVVEERAFDALNVLGAASGVKATVRTVGKFTRAVTDTLTDVRANLKLADALDAIERLRNQRQTPEIQAQIDLLRRDVKSLQKGFTEGGATRELIDAAVAKKVNTELGQGLLDVAQKNIVDADRLALENVRPFRETDRIDLASNGTPVGQIRIGEDVGGGGIKNVFDTDKPDVVLQRFIAAGDEAAKRDFESGRRFREIGIKTPDDVPFLDKDGNVLKDANGNPVLAITDAEGRVLKQTERIDGSKEAALLARNNPDGRLTPEQFAATAEAAAKATDKGFILTDLKPSNVALVLDENARLEVNAFDRDGVVRLEDVIEKRRKDPSLLSEGETPEKLILLDEEFDLSTPEGAQKLQSLIIDGPEVCCPKLNKDIDLNDDFGKAILTQVFSTDEFSAVFSGAGKFSKVRPDLDGKPLTFRDLAGGGATRLLDEARDQRIFDRAKDIVEAGEGQSIALSEADAIIGASKVIRDAEKAADALKSQVEALKQTASATTALSEAEGRRRGGGGGGGGSGGSPELPQIDPLALGNLLEETEEEAGERQAHDDATDAIERDAAGDLAVAGDQDGQPNDGFPEGE